MAAAEEAAQHQEQHHHKKLKSGLAMKLGMGEAEEEQQQQHDQQQQEPGDSAPGSRKAAHKMSDMAMKLGLATEEDANGQPQHYEV